MNKNHTAEPWRVSPLDGTRILAHSYVVAITDGPGGICTDDARRIVACVNACAGIPTDELEHAGMIANLEPELIDAQHAPGGFHRDASEPGASDPPGTTPAGAVPGYMGQWITAERCAFLAPLLHTLLDANEASGDEKVNHLALRILADDMEHVAGEAKEARGHE